MPPALQISVETLVDNERALLSAVLLGFTRSGDHLVSYTSGEDGWHLQLWSFAPGMRCKRLYNVPIFATQAEDGTVLRTGYTNKPSTGGRVRRSSFSALIVSLAWQGRRAILWGPEQCRSPSASRLA